MPKAKKPKTCPLPKANLLKRANLAAAGANWEKWMKTAPTAVHKWAKCVKPGSMQEMRRYLRGLKKDFLSSPGAHEIMQQSSCTEAEVLSLFDPRASVAQAEHAARCVAEMFEKKTAAHMQMHGIVRVDENCERNKRNMINRARNIHISAVSLLAGAVYCCVLPFSTAAWCPVAAAVLITERIANAELKSAREFECPKCSDVPMSARRIGQEVGSVGGRVPLTYTALGEDDGKYSSYSWTR